MGRREGLGHPLAFGDSQFPWLEVGDTPAGKVLGAAGKPTHPRVPARPLEAKLAVAFGGRMTH